MNGFSFCDYRLFAPFCSSRSIQCYKRASMLPLMDFETKFSMMKLLEQDDALFDEALFFNKAKESNFETKFSMMKLLEQDDALFDEDLFFNKAKDPLTLVDSMSLGLQRSSFSTTFRGTRSSFVRNGGMIAQRVEKFIKADDFLQDLTERFWAIEGKLLDSSKYEKVRPTLALARGVKKFSVKKEWEALDGSKAEYSYKYEPKKSDYKNETCNYSRANNLKKMSVKEEWKALDGSKAELSFKYEPKHKKPTEKITTSLSEFKTLSEQKSFHSKPKVCSEPEIRVIPIKEGKEESSVDAVAAKKLQLAFNRSRALATVKGKKTEMSPHEAAFIIQEKFREHMAHRSQTLRSLKELAVAKERLKELRSLFSNYAYRRLLFKDEEEKQRFSEKVVVLLLTVDSIEGSNYLVRESRKSMVQELESMLDALDPQNGSFRKRKFDLPDSGRVDQNLEMEVQQVVGMVDAKNAESSA
eukprot:TRINITY_DN4583_c0_g1_i1.p1 TRINITY_DN4583_c0_g1~~TRINITY_DN4583_c0_g1_i1.p1  ORF type:complete len:470 (-),score=92.27 TRINITY_DN4583_c0_g1_i1:83-1492(-)